MSSIDYAYCLGKKILFGQENFADYAHHQKKVKALNPFF
ncbi:hypothetical protein yrohd0001_13540 [Yersinia rohdei ATCC 43380]|nr:hypothetical protein yrohd0001_13540 [Yersinia rohdei ATCC 43380]